MKGAVQCPVWLLRRYIYFTACDLYWLNVRCVFWVCTNMTSNITLVHSDSALLLKRVRALPVGGSSLTDDAHGTCSCSSHSFQQRKKTLGSPFEREKNHDQSYTGIAFWWKSWWGLKWLKSGTCDLSSLKKWYNPFGHGVHNEMDCQVEYRVGNRYTIPGIG